MGGCLANAQLSVLKHPVILQGKDVLARLIGTSKHHELLHAESTLIADLNSKYHIIESNV